MNGREPDRAKLPDDPENANQDNEDGDDSLELSWQTEGGHDAPWSLEATPAPIAMAPDSFCDGAIFAPAP